MQLTTFRQRWVGHPCKTCIETSCPSTPIALPSPHQPLSHLILPLKIKPRLLIRQEQLEPHKEQASRLQMGDGLTIPVVAQLELGFRPVEGQTLLPCCGHLHQELLVGSWIQGAVGLQGTGALHHHIHAGTIAGVGAEHLAGQAAGGLPQAFGQIGWGPRARAWLRQASASSSWPGPARAIKHWARV